MGVEGVLENIVQQIHKAQDELNQTNELLEKYPIEKLPESVAKNMRKNGDWREAQKRKWEYRLYELNIIKVALESRVARKPIKRMKNPDGTDQYSCSICGRLWWEQDFITKYCDGCGTAVEREVDYD